MDRRKVDVSAAGLASARAGVALVASVAVAVGGAALEALGNLATVQTLDLPLLDRRKKLAMTFFYLTSSLFSSFDLYLNQVVLVAP